MAKFEAHEIISKIKEFASTEKRAPSVGDLINLGISERQVRNCFGMHSVAIRAAGLEPLENGNKKNRREEISNFFAVDIAELINSAEENFKVTNLGLKKGFSGSVIGDPHSPITSQKGLERFYKWIEHYQPDMIGTSGDNYDMFGASKHVGSKQWLNMKQELLLGKEILKRFWETCHRLSPKSLLVQICGNHDIRPIKRCLEKAPELEPFMNLEPWLKFDGVHNFMNPKEIVMLNNEVELTHFNLGKTGDYAAARKHNVIRGHTHDGNIVFVTLPDGRVIWEAPCGHMAIMNTEPMRYSMKDVLNPKHHKGFTHVDNWGPRFIAL